MRTGQTAFPDRISPETTIGVTRKSLLATSAFSVPDPAYCFLRRWKRASADLA
jgi:hypothetical protein